MADRPAPTIRCKKCGTVFPPDLKTKGVWVCPSCQGKNPNLRRHYRSVADVGILGLFFAVIAIMVGISGNGPGLGTVLQTADSILLLAMIIAVYRSASPWTNRTAKNLIWIVFGIAALDRLVTLLVLQSSPVIPALLVYLIVFPYLFWLNAQANKCSPDADSSNYQESRPA